MAPQSRDGLRGRMAVGVLRSHRDDRDPRSDGIEECLRRRSPAPVVGHLQEVDVGKPAGQEDGIDPLLDVTGEEESLVPECSEQDDRDVVDASAGIRRVGRH